MDEKFYVNLNDDDIKRINCLLHKQWEKTNNENIAKNALDCDLSTKQKEEIKKILMKEPTKELITLLTFNARRFSRHEQHRVALTVTNSKVKLDEAIEVINKANKILEPSTLLKLVACQLDFEHLNDDEYLYVERLSAVSKAFLEDTLQKLIKLRTNLPEPQKGNRDKSDEIMMLSVLTARVYKEVNEVYRNDDLMKREERSTFKHNSKFIKVGKY